MHCFSYLPKLWSVGPDSGTPSSPPITAVTSNLMNSVLGDVLTLIQKHIGVSDAPWMNRIASEYCLLEFKIGRMMEGGGRVR